VKKKIILSKKNHNKYYTVKPSYVFVRVKGYIPLPSGGAVLAGMGVVCEFCTRRLPVPNPTYYTESFLKLVIGGGENIFRQIYFCWHSYDARQEQILAKFVLGTRHISANKNRFV
jgi:hypothetical protein